MLETLGFLDHPHQNHVINFQETFMLINFITHSFRKILQKNSKLVILGNLGMPGHTRLKW